MELVSELPNSQFFIPAAVVVLAVLAVPLIYAFGFKSAQQPPFDKLSSGVGDDRKAAGKKRKTKDKVSLILLLYMEYLTLLVCKGFY